MEYDFTAELEGRLDLVSDGKLAWKQLLTEFWKGFKSKIEEVGELRVTNVLDVLNDVLAARLFPPKLDERPASLQVKTRANVRSAMKASFH